MTSLIVFLAISGGIFWAAIGAVAVALLVCWVVDKCAGR